MYANAMLSGAAGAGAAAAGAAPAADQGCRSHRGQGGELEQGRALVQIIHCRKSSKKDRLAENEERDYEPG
jgi:hypothetical protein